VTVDGLAASGMQSERKRKKMWTRLVAPSIGETMPVSNVVYEAKRRPRRAVSVKLAIWRQGAFSRAAPRLSSLVTSTPALFQFGGFPSWIGERTAPLPSYNSHETLPRSLTFHSKSACRRHFLDKLLIGLVT